MKKFIIPTLTFILGALLAAAFTWFVVDSQSTEKSETKADEWQEVKKELEQIERERDFLQTQRKEYIPGIIEAGIKQIKDTKDGNKVRIGNFEAEPEPVHFTIDRENKHAYNMWKYLAIAQGKSNLPECMAPKKTSGAPAGYISYRQIRKQGDFIFIPCSDYIDGTEYVALKTEYVSMDEYINREEETTEPVYKVVEFPNEDGSMSLTVHTIGYDKESDEFSSLKFNPVDGCEWMCVGNKSECSVDKKYIWNEDKKALELMEHEPTVCLVGDGMNSEIE